MKQWVKVTASDGLIHLIDVNNVWNISYDPDDGTTTLYIHESSGAYTHEIDVNQDLDQVCSLLGITYRV